MVSAESIQKSFFISLNFFLNWKLVEIRKNPEGITKLALHAKFMAKFMMCCQQDLAYRYKKRY
jgi:hypothetical protein